VSLDVKLQCAVSGDPELVCNDRCKDALSDGWLHFGVLSHFIKNPCKSANHGLDMASNPKTLKLHFFDRSLQVIGTEVRVS
jgi:hypothetical protein